MALDFTDDVFSAEDVQFVIQNAIKNVCTNPDVPYSNKNINNVINNIASDCLRDLEKLKRPFKYVVTCIIMQKNGAGMNTAAATFWDASKDGQVVVHWSNPSMNVVVTVYGVGLNIDNAAELE
mmetsp:Transcript_67793/g.187300  ORF Transcript_67793/g.187300 Transcript_67793/m.187300 type:complete len:123 (-) Transcript_67793:766-1134(-)